jgi:hypothetical protein
MVQTSQQLYLDLLKKTLLFTLWPDPPVPITTFNHRYGPLKRLLVTAISKVLDRQRLQLVQKHPSTLPKRLAGLPCWPGNAHTLNGLKQLDHLQQCIESILHENVAGDLIETGVWRGGSCIFMRAVLAAYGVQDRSVFVADSFEGLPPSNPAQFPADVEELERLNWLFAVSQAEVEANFRNYGLLDEQVVFLKGWFKDTLPQAPIEKLAILRLDGDLYESTMQALQHLYPKLSDGGFCIVDDYYHFASCRAAVDDYRAQHGIQTPLNRVDWKCTYWRKCKEN